MLRFVESDNLGENMPEKIVYKLTPEQIAAIEAVVSRGDRVEVVPVKDGLKLLRTRRNIINPLENRAQR